MDRNDKAALILKRMALADTATSDEEQAMDGYADRYDAWLTVPKGKLC